MTTVKQAQAIKTTVSEATTSKVPKTRPHLPFLDDIRAIVPSGLLALELVAVPVVVLVSWLFSMAFERPFIPRSPAAERLAAP